MYPIHIFTHPLYSYSITHCWTDLSAKVPSPLPQYKDLELKKNNFINVIFFLKGLPHCKFGKTRKQRVRDHHIPRT